MLGEERAQDRVFNGARFPFGPRPARLFRILRLVAGFQLPPVHLVLGPGFDVELEGAEFQFLNVNAGISQRGHDFLLVTL